jgi:hypothetical protein
MKWLVAGAAAFLVTIGTAGAQPPPNYAPIPPPRVEVVPPPPGGRVIWEPGHWRWNGYRYIWISGRYVQARPSYRHYVEGRWIWSPREGRYVWREPHWE